MDQLLKENNTKGKSNKQNDFTMYIIINKDLSMGKGKIASQTGHAVHIMVHNILTNKNGDELAKLNFVKYTKWNNKGSKTIVLNVPFDKMKEMLANEKYTNKCVYVCDAGRTQVEPGSVTAIGFYPADDLMEDMKEFKLL